MILITYSSERNTLEQIRYDGQVAVVTGAGRGMGRSHAITLAARGAAVVVNDVDVAAADEVTEAIRSAGGAAVASCHAIGEPEAAAAIVADAMDAFGRIDVLINNAGFMRNGYLEDMTRERFDAVLDVHLRGHFFLTQAVWPIMRANSYGRVVMVGSGGGLFTMPAASNYAAAKAGLYGLGKALSCEGERYGILVNVLLPGANTTIAANEPLPEAAERLSGAGLGPLLGSRRMPEAVSAMVGYLASRECAVNGEAFVANCGIFTRVFIGVTMGWVSDDPSTVSMEDIAQHLDEIRSNERYEIPTDDYDHLGNLARRLGWTGN